MNLPRGRLLSLAGLVLCLAAIGLHAGPTAGPTAGENAANPSPCYPKDLSPRHWAYHAARDLAARGILTGFPDGTFRGDRPVNRATLARALARTLEATNNGGQAAGSLALPPRDLKTMARLTQEFSKELSALTLRTSALEEKTEGQRVVVAGLREKVDGLSRRIDTNDRFSFKSGEIRLVGNDHQELQSFSNLILNFEYRVNDRITGLFAPQFINTFDRNITEGLGVWLAYTDFADLGPIDTLRVGRQMSLVGAGLTLFNRVEGFSLMSTYGDLFLQAILLGDLMLLVETEAASGQRLGFYYIEESKNLLGRSPVHLGTYLKGHLGDRLYFGFEYANYGNRAVTTANRDTYTEGYLADLRWEPSRSLLFKASFIAAEEDFRAVSIDHDLAYHSPVSSPLEDVLQAITSASKRAQLTVDKNEINGFKDVKVGVEFVLPHSRVRLGLDVDRLRDYSHFFDNTGNEFTLYGIRLKRPFTEDSWLELRARRLKFDRPDSFIDAGTLGIPRVDVDDVRLQWFTTF